MNEAKEKGNLFEEKSFIFFLKPNIYCMHSIYFFLKYDDWINRIPFVFHIIRFAVLFI
jgi:hypothetical protein